MGLLLGHLADQEVNGVSILVLVDRGVGTVLRLSLAIFLISFQSLFWWIEGLGQHVTLNGTTAVSLVSILVLVDRGVGTDIQKVPEVNFDMFQSLFWWIEGLGLRPLRM